RIYGINSLTGAINIVTVKPNRTGIEAQVNAGTNFKDNEENPDKIYSSKGIQIAGSYADENQNHLLSGDLQSGSGHRYNTDRKSTRLNSSHVKISYAVFCLKKEKNHPRHTNDRHY